MQERSATTCARPPRRRALVCVAGVLPVLAVAMLAGCGLEAGPARPESARAEVAAPSQAPVAPTAVQPFPAAAPADRAPVRSLAPRVRSEGSALISYSGSATPGEVRTAHLMEVRRLECGDTHVDYAEQFDHWHRLDLDGDDGDELAVFFTLEGFGGGNNYARYLAVYRYVEPVWFASTVMRVGGKGSANVSGATLRLADGVLSTEAMLADDDDGACCPSVASELSFDVGAGGALTPRPVALSETGEAHEFLLSYVSDCD